MPSSKSELYIGIMSGTSLDGVDAVCVNFKDSEILNTYRVSVPYSAELKEELLLLCYSGPNEIERSQIAAREISKIYAEACEKLLLQEGLEMQAIKAIGAHGQTIRHNPHLHATTQILDGALLAELTNIPVVCDFRSRDMAAGGQGAPLVPAFHQEVFTSEDKDRAIINIGGISNITVLPSTRRGVKAFGFDCGPGNVLMDGWINAQFDEPFDMNGDWARQGQVIPWLMEAFMSDPFFGQEPPKSTGREVFNIDWIQHNLYKGSRVKAEDVQRTLLELTQWGIIDALKRFAPTTNEIYICGGGARNKFLMERVAEEANGIKVSDTSELGLSTQDVEGAAFAWLAKRFMERLPGNLPSATGAKGHRILGCLYPA